MIPLSSGLFQQPPDKEGQGVASAMPAVRAASLVRAQTIPERMA